MTNQEAWETQYMVERYLQHLDSTELNQYFADVLSNMFSLNDSGKLEIAQDVRWLEKSTNLFLEYRLRQSGLPDFRKIQDKVSLPNVNELALALRVKAKLPEQGKNSLALIKYGKAKHLRPLFESGTLRLFPATRYKDDSLNIAVRDNELEFTKIVGTSRTTYKAATNFYCFCSAWWPNNRLTHDFEADSALLIRNPHEFFLRVARAFNKPEWKFRFQQITYIDPHLMKDHDHVIDLVFVKHFRYCYQAEHRLAIYPPKPMRDLPEIEIQLGPLTDITEFVD